MRVLSLLSGLLCLALTGGAAWSSTPQAVIPAIQRAIDTRDVQAFARAVDLDHLLRSTLIQVLDTHDPREFSLPPAIALLAEQARDTNLRLLLLPVLVEEGKRFVLYGVESGHFAGEPDGSVSPPGLLAPWLERVASGRKSLRLTGSSREDGNAVLLPVELDDAGSGRTTFLLLRLAEQNGQWRVQEIDDLGSLLRAVE